MGEIMEPFVKEYGVSIVGGCCGTRPDHIRVLYNKFKDAKPIQRETDPHIYVSGPQEVAALDSSEGLVRIGEMLNVRGSKKSARRSGNRGRRTHGGAGRSGACAGRRSWN